jgi:hypothetical protein
MNLSQAHSTCTCLLSPDRRVEIRFALGDGYADGRRLSDVPLWQVWFAGRQMLRESRVGTCDLNLVGSVVDVDPGKTPDCGAGGFEVTGVVRHRCRRTWEPAGGDAATLVDHHNELVARLRERAAPHRRINLVFRCSNQGAAVRVRLPRQRGLARVRPAAGGAVFRFPEGTMGRVPAGGVPGAASGFRKVALDEVTAASEVPLVLNYAHGKLACLLQVDGAARQLPPACDGLAPQGEPPPAAVKTPHESPWQVLLLGDSPCDLLQNRGLLLNLGGASAQRGSDPANGAAGLVPPLLPPPGAAATPAHLAAQALVCGEGAARWDETRYLRGAIGEFMVVARRLGRVWQVAGITGAEARILTVRLAEVLGSADESRRSHASYASYALCIVRDPLPNETAEGGFVREAFHGVDAADKPRLELPPHGGFLLRLEPED